MRALVTGGAGFIGSHLVRKLEAWGDEVVVVDNWHTGAPSNLWGTKARVLKLDSKDLMRATDGPVADFKPDVVFHLGIYSSSPMYQKDRSLVGEVVAGATSVLEYARAKSAKVVYAATSSVYAGNKTPYREDMPTPVPTDFYTEARLSLERLAALYHTVYGVPAMGLRFFSVYGPGEESKGVYANMVTQFVWAAKGLAMKYMGKRPTVYGDGSIERDLVYVDDVTEALLLAARTRTDSGVVNVGTGVCHSLSKILAILSEKTGKDMTKEVDWIPMPGGYMGKQRADTTKAERVLGFQAKIHLERGLDMVLRNTEAKVGNESDRRA